MGEFLTIFSVFRPVQPGMTPQPAAKGTVWRPKVKTSHCAAPVTVPLRFMIADCGLRIMERNILYMISNPLNPLRSFFARAKNEQRNTPPE